ncbi:MAG: transketolase family protein [Clostridiales bacterium]|jgi:transketolase|nr:transketolase family protein [Clostridiales bacterium]
MAKDLTAVLCENLHEVMKENEKVAIVGADLIKTNGLAPLIKQFPERIVNVGIAEQNMAGVAAGMASYGMIPVINSFAAFATRRICDQIAVSICYANSNVKIIGTDPGITAELNGGTHMTFEDIGVLRSIPNIMILEPSDAEELKQMVPAIFEIEGPVYIRMYRKATPDVHNSDYKFQLGKADVLKTGKDVSIISSGIMVSEAVKAAEELSQKGIEAEVINIHTIKPLDAEAIIKSAQKTGAIVTAENHNILGGLRGAVAEVITENYPVKIYPVGVKDIKGEVGTMPYLRERFGLTSAEIVKAAEKAVKEK